MATSISKISLVSPIVGDEEAAGVLEVLRSGQLAQGPVVAAFEREFALEIGAQYAVAVNSGTAALHCGLQALGVRAGDEILTTPFTFAASATPALMLGASVRFVDVDERTFNVDVDRFAEAAGERTTAVIGVDLFGLPFDRAGSSGLQDRGIRIFEDACQAIGAERDGKSAGTDCDAASFSFYATKNLMTGEGGMLTTNDAKVAESARRFRHHGMTQQYEYEELGYNYRLTDLLAAIGRAQLKRLTFITERRGEIAAHYNALLATVPEVQTPFVPAGTRHAYHQYTIVVDPKKNVYERTRDDVRAALAQAGIASGVYYPKPLHLHPLFGGPHRAGEFPVSERLARSVLSLPIHPGLSNHDVERVAQAIATALQE